MHNLTLGNYKDLNIPSASNFNQSDLDKAVVESVLNAANTWNKVYNPIEKGDHITLRVEAKESGLIVTELCNSALEYEVGDKAMLPQFSEAIGKKQGESFVMHIPFAEKCPIEKIRNKTVDFEAVITNVEHQNQVTIDDNLAPKLDPSCTTIQQIKDKFAEIIKANYNQNVEEQNNDNILNKIAEDCKVEFDTDLYKETYDMVTEQTRKMLEGFPMPSKSEVDKAEEDKMFEEDCKALTEKMIKDSLIINAVAQTEKIIITTTEVAENKKLYTADEISAQEFTKFFPNDESFAQFLLRDKVLAFLRQANLQ